MTLAISIASGILGGLLRALKGALFGWLDREPVQWRAWWLALLLSLSLGALFGAIISFLAVSQFIALFAGYAGFELLQSMQKIVSFKKIAIPIEIKSVSIKSIPKQPPKKSLWNEMVGMK